MTALRPLAAAALAASMLAAPVLGASAPYYQAELSAPASEARIVAGGLLWSCEGTACVAGKDNSRPLVVCKKLARETAAIARFTAAGEDLSADDLARCNG